MWLASWSSGQGLWLLIMRSRVWFPVLPWEVFLAEKDSRSGHGVVVSRFMLKASWCFIFLHVTTHTPSGQRSRASWASQTQKSATLSPQPGEKPRKFVRTCGGIGNIYIYFVMISQMPYVKALSYFKWNSEKSGMHKISANRLLIINIKVRSCHSD